jgi:hypothetical protein
MTLDLTFYTIGRPRSRDPRSSGGFARLRTAALLILHL